MVAEAHPTTLAPVVPPPQWRAPRTRLRRGLPRARAVRPRVLRGRGGAGAGGGGGGAVQEERGAGLVVNHAWYRWTLVLETGPHMQR